jgi:predicted glutamine amidotransferase
MCRLFGIIANREVDIQFSFFRADKPFKELIKQNWHGWGIGWYENGEAKIFKEASNQISNYNFDIVKSVRSKIIISHLRFATTGEKKKYNTHPFNYKNFIFAHNGMIDGEKVISHLNKDFKNNLKGETDSEVYFMLIMQFFEENEDIIDAIRNAVNVIKGYEYTGLNFLLSDGNNLYAFRDAKIRQDYYSLYYLKRTPSENKLFEYLSKETLQMLQSKALLNEMAVLCSSEKLTKGENWNLINIGNLVVIDSNLNIEMIEI